MCIGWAECLDKSHLCAIADTSDNLVTLKDTSKSLIDYSPMVYPDLSNERKDNLAELLRTFSGVFTKADKSKTTRTNVKHRINIGDHAPIHQRAYRVSPIERRIIREEVHKMLDKCIVQTSESPWSSPVVLVRKKDRSLRFCVVITSRKSMSILCLVLPILWTV
ncbi:hypothetical protein AVEN_29321-1 [Araneus ventricosus]|uniref:Transposon Ty3-I Gag-Pol polyprotein n=1 Tax=Araneus ventricosus TaxID=182803 RepID=A0A4Y2IX83_ARAVE|nr:hypothetical protein AVEN_29321-1 [Araneus ventricosus]